MFLALHGGSLMPTGTGEADTCAAALWEPHHSRSLGGGWDTGSAHGCIPFSPPAALTRTGGFLPPASGQRLRESRLLK